MCGARLADLPHYPVFIRIAPFVRFDDPTEGGRLFDDELIGRNELAVLGLQASLNDEIGGCIIRLIGQIGTVRNLVCGAIVEPLEADYGD
jgi:hypothetical protein